ARASTERSRRRGLGREILDSAGETPRRSPSRPNAPRSYPARPSRSTSVAATLVAPPHEDGTQESGQGRRGPRLGNQPVSSAPRSGGEQRGVSGGELTALGVGREFPPEIRASAE